MVWAVTSTLGRKLRPRTTTLRPDRPRRTLVEAVDEVGGHGVVDVAAEGGEFAGAFALDEEVRVDGDAVAADAGAGDVEVAVGLAVGGFADLAEVDAVDVGDAGEFVGEGNVEVAVDAFGELAEFGCFGAGETEDGGPERFRIELGGAAAGFLIEATDDGGVLVEVFEDAAHEKALGAEGNVHVFADVETAGLEQRRQRLAGGADGERGVEDAERAGFEAVAD